MTKFLIKSLICACTVFVFSHAQAELVDKSKTLVKTEADMLAYYAQNFAARDASWRRAPRLELPQRVLRRSRSGEIFKLEARLTVDKQGEITSVEIVQSSGNPYLDAAAKNSFRKAQLHPFIREGEPVEAYVIVPVEFKVLEHQCSIPPDYKILKNGC